MTMTAAQVGTQSARQAMAEWVEYFECNREERLPIPWALGITVEPGLRAPLIRSLQRFQVGEQGDGIHLRAGAAATGDPLYERAIMLFVKEEQEHSRLLAALLDGLGAPLLTWHWSDICFTLMRRMRGLRLELLVLLIAELIAKRYYRALHEGTADPVLRGVFAQILRDEEGHVAFHCTYLRWTLAPWPRARRRVVRACWWLLFRLVCLGVLHEHRAVLRAVAVSPGVFWRESGRIFNEAAASIFRV
jgi:hypothetical protein